LAFLHKPSKPMARSRGQGDGASKKSATSPGGGANSSSGAERAAPSPGNGAARSEAARELTPPAAAGSDGSRRGSNALLWLTAGILLGAAAGVGAVAGLTGTSPVALLQAGKVPKNQPCPECSLKCPKCPECPKCPKCSKCPECPAAVCPTTTPGEVECQRSLEELRIEGRKLRTESEQSGTQTKELRVQMKELSTQRDELRKQSDERQERVAVLQAEQRSQSAEWQEKVAKLQAEHSTQSDELQEKLAKLQAEHEALKQAAEAATVATEKELAKADSSIAAETPTQQRATGWPQCLEHGVVLRGRGQFAAYEDVATLLGSAASGCWMDNCRSTDKLEADRFEDCARICAALTSCSFWTHGEQDGAQRCFLRTGDGGRESAAGFISASKDCTPPATEVESKQAVLAVLDSPALAACDGGVVGDTCSDLKDAMRTWQYAIKTLNSLLEGLQHNFGDLLSQIGDDVAYFLDVPASAGNLGEMYAIAASNNRQVLKAVRGWLSDRFGAEEASAIHALDVSVPRPVRGLLCSGSCEV